MHSATPFNLRIGHSPMRTIICSTDLELLSPTASLDEDIKGIRCLSAGQQESDSIEQSPLLLML